MLALLLACVPATVTPTPPKDTGPAFDVTREVVTGEIPDTGGRTGDSATDSPPTDSPPLDSPPIDTAPPEDTSPVEVDPCAATPGRLSVGDDHDVDIDGYTGDAETTEPKTDANDGADGDNPEFQRHNVARGHCGGDSCYWYTSSHQESGEPDPNGEQWVDYTPDFTDLGVGWYQVTARYRQTTNRASYPAWYTVTHRDGSTLTEIDQRDGTDDVSFDLGTYWMCPDSTVRVEDTGGDSITFNEMTFVFVGT